MVLSMRMAEMVWQVLMVNLVNIMTGELLFIRILLAAAVAAAVVAVLVAMVVLSILHLLKFLI